MVEFCEGGGLESRGSVSLSVSLSATIWLWCWRGTGGDLS